MTTVTFEWIYFLPVAVFFLHVVAQEYYERNEHHHDGTLTMRGGFTGGHADLEEGMDEQRAFHTTPMDRYKGPWS